MSPSEQMALSRWIERRDPEAFRSIVSAYSGLVYGTCRRILGDAAEAEDVTQECFEALACTAKPPHGYLGPWLHRVATNMALKQRRSDSRRKRREVAYQTEGRSPSYEEVRWDDVFNYVDEAIAELPESYRTPLVRHFLEDESHAAIAESLGVSRQTVTHRIGSGVELLRKSLKRKGIPTVSASLVALLGVNLKAQAAPPALVATLGKLALAGVDLGAGAGVSAGLLNAVTGFFASVSKAGMGVAAVLLVAVAGITVYSWPHHDVAPPAQQATASAPQAAEAQANVDPQNLASEGQAAPAANEEPGTESAKLHFLHGPGHITGQVSRGPKGGPPISTPAQVLVERLDWDLMGMPPARPAILETQSSPDGRIDLSGLDYGVYVVTMIQGENNAVDWFSVDPQDLENEAGGYLEPRGVIHGRVVDRSGRGIAGAVVYPFPKWEDWAHNEAVTMSRFAAARRALTQADGVFVLEKASKETRCLLVKAPGFAPTFSGTVIPGDAPITLTTETGGSLSGQVVETRTEQPLPGVQVLVWGHVIQDSQTCKTDASGRFRADHLRAGPVAVHVFDREYISLEDAVQIEVQPDRESETPVLTAAPGGVIEGRVFNAETGEGIPGYAVPLDFTDHFVQLDPIVTNASGQYRVPALIAKNTRVTLNVLDSAGYWIDPAAHEQGFDIRYGTRFTGVDIALNPTHTLAGTVVDLGAKPVAAAQVRLYTNTGQTLAETVSDAEGRFSIEGTMGSVPSSLMAEKETLTSPRIELSGYSKADLRDITLHLQTGYPVAGRLVDASNHPLDGWLIKAASLDQLERTCGPTETGHAGAFRFPALLPGPYALLVAPPRTLFQGNEEYLRVEAGPGMQNERLIVTYDQGLSISGKVTSSNGLNADEALLSCVGPVCSTTATEKNGSYVLRGLAEGAYTVRVIPRDGTCCMARQENVAAGSTHVDFDLQPRLTCRGNVRRADTLEPVSNFEVAVVPGTVTYVPAGPSHAKHEGVFTRSANPEGAFSLSFSLDAGPNTVIVRAQGYATAFVSVNPEESHSNPDLDILLQPGGELHGGVANAAGQPVAGAMVFIGPLPDRANFERAAAARSGVDGRFALSQVPTGAVTLACWAKGYAPCIRRANASEDSEVDFVLSPGSSLEGIVRMGGEPVANATVSVTSVDGPDLASAVAAAEPHALVQNTRTRADGSYAFTNLPEGEMLVEVGVWEMGNQARPTRGIAQWVDLTGDAASRLDVDFPVATAALGGHVTVDGAPAANAVASLEVATRAGNERVTVMVLPDGSIAADRVPAGPATLTVQAYDPNGQAYRATRRFAIAGDEPVQVDLALPEEQAPAGPSASVKDNVR